MKKSSLPLCRMSFVLCMRLRYWQRTKGDRADEKKVVHINLKATNNNPAGLARQLSWQWAKMRNQVDISRLPGFVARPAHIYTFIYEEPAYISDKKPVYKMNDTTPCIRQGALGRRLDSHQKVPVCAEHLACRQLYVVPQRPWWWNTNCFAPKYVKPWPRWNTGACCPCRPSDLWLKN